MDTVYAILAWASGLPGWGKALLMWGVILLISSIWAVLVVRTTLKAPEMEEGPDGMRYTNDALNRRKSDRRAAQHPTNVTPLAREGSTSSTRKMPGDEV